MLKYYYSVTVMEDGKYLPLIGCYAEDAEDAVKKVKGYYKGLGKKDLVVQSVQGNGAGGILF